MSIDRAEFGLIDLYEPLRLYFLVWAALVIVSLLLMFIVHSRFGVTLRAIKSNESRVEAMGAYAVKIQDNSLCDLSDDLRAGRNVVCKLAGICLA